MSTESTTDIARVGSGPFVRCTCPACGEPLPPIVWRSTTPYYIAEVSPERYAKFSDKVKRWYVPVYASPNDRNQPTP